MGKNIKTALHLMACAFIGLFLAFRIDRRFWWVGMIIGGIIGFVTFEPRAVRYWLAHYRKELFPPDCLARIRWKILGARLAYLADGISWTALYAAFLANVGNRPGNSAYHALAEIFLMSMSTVSWWGSVTAVSFIERSGVRSFAKSALLLFPPVFVLWTAPRAIIIEAWSVCRFLARQMLGVLRFCAKVAVAICTDTRLTASFSIALAIGIGWVAKSYLAGMAAAPMLFFAARLFAKKELPQEEVA